MLIDSVKKFNNLKLFQKYFFWKIDHIFIYANWFYFCMPPFWVGLYTTFLEADLSYIS